jgi:hypothetical protein
LRARSLADAASVSMHRSGKMRNRADSGVRMRRCAGLAKFRWRGIQLPIVGFGLGFYFGFRFSVSRSLSRPGSKSFSHSLAPARRRISVGYPWADGCREGGLRPARQFDELTAGEPALPEDRPSCAKATEGKFGGRRVRRPSSCHAGSAVRPPGPPIAI